MGRPYLRYFIKRSPVLILYFDALETLTPISEHALLEWARDNHHCYGPILLGPERIALSDMNIQLLEQENRIVPSWACGIPQKRIGGLPCLERYARS